MVSTPLTDAFGIDNRPRPTAYPSRGATALDRRRGAYGVRLSVVVAARGVGVQVVFLDVAQSVGVAHVHAVEQFDLV